MSSKNPAQQIDTLLASVAEAYRQLPRCSAVPVAFREAVSFAGLPGGYVNKNKAPRPLSETLPSEE